MFGKLTSNAARICCRLLSSRARQLISLSPLFLIKQRGFAFQPLAFKGTNFVDFKANFSTSNRIPVCNYDEVKELPNYPDKFLIDVREPQELIETGIIPGSINIPLGIVASELSADFPNDAFEKKYNRKKPHKDSEIIFHCKIGKRSANAAEKAMSLGYTNVKNYEGSWLDWAEREGLPK